MQPPLEQGGLLQEEGSLKLEQREHMAAAPLAAAPPPSSLLQPPPPSWACKGGGAQSAVQRGAGMGAVMGASKRSSGTAMGTVWNSNPDLKALGGMHCAEEGEMQPAPAPALLKALALGCAQPAPSRAPETAESVADRCCF